MTASPPLHTEAVVGGGSAPATDPTAGPVPSAVQPAAPNGRSLTRTIGLAILATAIVGFVLATRDDVQAADVVRLVLLGSWAAAGVAVAGVVATRRLGTIVLCGTTVGATRSVAVGFVERDRFDTVAAPVASIAAALVVAFGIHLVAALPTGEIRSRLLRGLVGAGYVTAALLGFWDHTADGVGTLPLVALGAVGAAVTAPAAHRLYVESKGVVRQRLQWLGVAVALVVETVLVVGPLHLLVDWPPQPGVVIGSSLVLVALALIAGSSTRVVGRVESLLQHAVSLAGSSAVVVATYVVVVIGLGRVPTDEERTVLVLSMVAAAVAALAFIPARARLTETANRLVYGEANDPSEALETFGQRMTRALPMDELLLQLSELLKKHLGLVRAEVWSGADGRFERVASVPDQGAGLLVLGAKELPVVARAGVTGRTWASVWLPQLLEGRGEGSVRIAPMTSQGDVFGLIVVERTVGHDDFTEEDDRVLTELARQVGLAVKNSTLDLALKASLEDVKTANVELRRSRARIVASADAERRKIERNLHDGAQQHLVALAVKLRLIERVAATDVAAALAMLEDARTDVQATVDELRSLAHGIYPPLLMDRGLAEALRAAANRAVLPATVEAGGVGRFDEDVEAAVYFCVLEALQNAGKHAGDDATITVAVSTDDIGLRFEVADDGGGFDLGARSDGHGFVNMADRVGAIGGTVQVWSAPGQGTRIVGSVPASPRAVAEPPA